jgi:hypothetical protein
VILAAPFAAMALLGLGRGVSLRAGGLRLCRTGAATILAFGRLGGIGAQKTVFEGCAVKAANDGLHFIRGGSLDKSETFGLLRFVVANDFHGISHEVFRCQPLLNIVGSDPGGEIAKKYSKAHSVDLFTPLFLDWRDVKGGIRLPTYSTKPFNRLQTGKPSTPLFYLMPAPRRSCGPMRQLRSNNCPGGNNDTIFDRARKL